MKEMEYKKERTTRILDKGTIDNIGYCIVNYGTHPCAYLFLSKGHKFYGLGYDDIDINVHGGLTFSEDDLVFNPLVTDCWIIGWDYAHCGDYSGYYEDGKDWKKWTSTEILEEVKNAIKQIST